jgi:Nif-specific regulatory protein
MARLVIKTGPHRGMSFELTGERLSIGRDYGNHIQLADSKSSRHHAEIRAEDGEWTAWDLGSSNGTYVNRKQIKSHRLREGDVIRIGDTTLEFRSEVTRRAPKLERAATTAEIGRIETLAVERNRFLSGELGGSPEDLARATERLVKLYDLARAAAGSDTVAELFERIGESIEEALEADRVFPILYDEEVKKWTLWARATKTRGSIRLARAVADAPVSMGVVETVRSEGKAVLTRAAEDERFRDRRSVKANEIGTVICVPLVARERFLGVLYADRIAGGEDFDEGDLEFLDAAAAYAALALESLRVREAVSRKAEVLSREVRAEHAMVGSSAPMKRVYEFLERAAPVDAGVLVLGESGTGKELVARAVHYNSRRADGPFEVVNCAALTESLVESELFGHVKGAYTGATADRPGRFELADGGTIFLDEIGELPDSIQTKLLRVLEQGESMRVGDAAIRHVDVRVVAATNRDLDREVAEGRFRQDLFYRLNILRVELPPLRERGKDIDLLIDHYSEVFTRKMGRAAFTLAPEVRATLRAYSWPGNVRELKNVLERVAVLCPADPVTERDLPPGLFGPPALTEAARMSGASSRSGGSGGSGVMSLGDVEREHILRVLASAAGNKKRAAELLGIDRSTLYAKLKAYG